MLDGFYLLDKSGCDLPHEVISVRLSSKNIKDAAENDLNYFVNLIEIDLSENNLKEPHKLSGLTALEKLHLQNNGIENINFSEYRRFDKLLMLDLSYNQLNPVTLDNLKWIPTLRDLNLSGNDLYDLPDPLAFLPNLELLNLSSNKFVSDHTASRIWAHLAAAPKLREVNMSRNSFRGIHTEKLVAGDFENLEKLDFSFNKAENQHNLICARNFKTLKVLIVTGNPFAAVGQHKGLETELFTRIGAILINENVGLPYLKHAKKTAKPPIRFHNLFTLEPDKLVEDAKPTFFGVELPKEEEGDEEEEQQGEEREAPVQNMNEEEEEEEEEELGEEQEAGRFFLTENQQQQQQARYKQTKKIAQNYDQETPNGIIKEEPFDTHGSKEDFGDEYGRKNEYSPNVSGTQMVSKQEQLNLKEVKNMGEFKKAAHAVLGDSKEYDNPMELQSAYKMLKHMVHKPSVNISAYDSKLARNPLPLPKKMQKVGPTVKYRYNAGEARMMDVERMIDTLNKKFLNADKGEDA
jgi:hypothetical protein